MKIITATFAYNDWEYLNETLESIKDFGDKHYIIEGAWKASQHFGASPRSNKKTYEIIDKFVDNKRVFLVQANELREREQRQVGLELAKKEKADWFFMTDSDEIYTKSNLQIIRKILDKNKDNKNVLGFRIKSYNFINSFKRYYNGDYWRIYRPTEKAEFCMDNDVKFESDGIIDSISDFVKFYHYAYVKINNCKSFELKMNYQSLQDPSFDNRLRNKYGFLNGQYKIPEDIKIYDYNGKHPLIMKNHQYFIDDIYSDGLLSFF